MRWLILAAFALLITGCDQSPPPVQAQAPKEEKPAPRRGYSGPKRDDRQFLTVSCAAFSPDGKRLLTGYELTPQLGGVRPNRYGGVLLLWDAEEGRLLRTLPGQLEGARQVAFLPGGERAFSMVGEIVRVWDLRSGKITHEFRVCEGICYAAALTPDCKALLSQGRGSDGTLRLALHEVPSGQLLARYDYRRRINRIAFSPNGKWALFGCTPVLNKDGTEDKTYLELWDVQRQRVARSFSRGGPFVYDFPMAFSPNDRLVVSGKSPSPPSQSLVVWEAQTGQEVLVLEAEFPNGAMAVIFTPDGKRILRGGYDGLACHDAATGKAVWQRRDKLTDLVTLAFSPDGNVGFTAQGRPSISPRSLRLELWNTREGLRRCRLRIPEKK